MIELTNVERRGDLYFKRDDMFTVCGVNGGKARAAYHIIQDAINKGFNSFVTAGSRMSPQCEIVSAICESLHVSCHLFMPQGKETSIIRNIKHSDFSTIHRTKVGYNSVLLHDAKAFAYEHKHYYIPFGMECEENIEVTKHQVKNIPDDVKRIVIPCGSGMSMISVIKGLQYYSMFDKNLVGVVVGKNPQKTFDRFLGGLFNEVTIKYDFVRSEQRYDEQAKKQAIYGLELDPIYESKCIPFLHSGDLLWVVGKRKT